MGVCKLKHSEAGKGSAPRKNADQEAYAQNHEKIFGAVGPLARKKQEEALKKLVEFSQELKLYSEFDYIVAQDRKFIKMISSRDADCTGCAVDSDCQLCFALPACWDSGVSYIYKEVDNDT